jgi:hypothetical protein
MSRVSRLPPAPPPVLQSVPTPQRPWSAAAAEARGYEGEDGSDQPSVWKGLIAGLAAGAAGTVAMTLAMMATQKLASTNGAGRSAGKGAGQGRKSEERAARSERGDAGTGDRTQPERGEPGAGRMLHHEDEEGGEGNGGGGPGATEEPTVQVASAVARTVAGRDLTEDEKKVAGPLVHYAFGTSMGVLYALIAEYVPEVKAGQGTVFGTGLWLGADEAALPALGLAPPITETPPQKLVGSLVGHLLYGFVTEEMRRVVRGAL